MNYSPVFLTSILLLAACAGPEGESPSLAPRPIEGVVDEPIRGITPVTSAQDPALAGQIAQLVDQAEAGNRAFTIQYPEAVAAVDQATGSALESEAWIEAQLAVSALDSLRSETVRALGGLDSILAHQTLAAEPAETERLLAAREHVAALYDDQNRRYDALNSRLRTD